MADTIEEDDTPSKRESHFNQQRSPQRSSLRSDRSSNPHPHPRSRSHSHRASTPRLDAFDLSETLPSPLSPPPDVSLSKPRAGKSRGTARGRPRLAPDDLKRLEEGLAPSMPLGARDVPLRDVEKFQWLRRNHSFPTTRGTKTPARSRRPSHFTATRATTPGSQLDITALPSFTASATAKADTQVPKHPSMPLNGVWTELYTVSYLIFFAIWGTLARIGLQALTFYPGAPVIFSELWANVAGTFIMGFLVHDQRLFRIPSPSPLPPQHDAIHQHIANARSKQKHNRMKARIPLYIGLATGFCGSFTSFSSFMRDMFLSMSNDLASPSSTPQTLLRHPAYSLPAVLATTILTLSTCFVALKTGAHLAHALNSTTPTLPPRLLRILDPLILVLAPSTWLATLLLTIFLPAPLAHWRSSPLFALLLSPPGCLARFYFARHINPLIPSFPLGTFAVNIFGSAVLAVSFDLQRVPLLAAGVAGGSVLGCQVLQGVMDGFCGALTTVSTWVVELEGLKKAKAYVYGAASLGVGVGVVAVVMGSVRWGRGWEGVVCGV